MFVGKETVSDRTEVARVVVDNGMAILQAPKLVFLDWDTEEGEKRRVRQYEESGEPTAKNAEEAIGRLTRFAFKDQSFWVLYETAGGIRAMCLSRAESPNRFWTEEVIRATRPDPAYIRCCKQRDAWAARVSRKPDREGSDLISFLGVVGSGQANPDMLRGARLHHWLLLENGMTTQEMPSMFRL